MQRDKRSAMLPFNFPLDNIEFMGWPFKEPFTYGNTQSQLAGAFRISVIAKVH